ncbi:MAG: hypothetical protein NT152_05990 [Actinobacteria bacterium]|nr:hypothetical protein [Actinomycetota bacterium]
MSKQPRSRLMKVVRASTLLAPVFLLTSCAKIPGFGYEEGLSSVNETTLPLWQGAWITAAVVGLFTLPTAYRCSSLRLHRARSIANNNPSQQYRDARHFC